METKTQVLVVGAGPVGLMTALHLKRHGVDVQVIDQAEPDSAGSFAVVLHPRTVEMLAEFGVVEPLRWQGHSFERITVFVGSERRAQLTMPVDSEYADGALTLPQNVLRIVLESTLRTAGVAVEYGQKLVSLEQHANEVHTFLLRPRVGASEPPRSTSTPRQARVVSEFVVGADGFHSTVRELLGISLTKLGKERPFAFFDVQHPASAGPTAEFVFGAHASAMYPLRDDRTRYSFELALPSPEAVDASELEALLRSRMPWHETKLEAVEWAGVRNFPAQLAERFGRGRVWLAGDACHGTSPIGAQSLNVGLREARDLADALFDSLRGRALEHIANGYAEQRRLEWRRLLAIGEVPSFGAHTPGWAVQHFEQLITSLPASRDDLDDLLEQLGIVML